jgi:metal-responsive CopG/Arc/MetJ family transcriptional regulator
MPDETYARATESAAHLGVSRSELVTRAVQRYLDQLDEQSLTRQIDAVLDLVGEDDSGAAAVGAGRRPLAADDDDW